MLLPALNLPAVILIRQDKVGLNPGNTLPGINQQFGNTASIQAAIFVELFPALFRDRFNATLHRYAVGAAQQVERFLIPEIDARLESNLHLPLGNPLQQAADILPNPENLIDEVDVFHATSNQGVHFLKQISDFALAELIAEQRLVAESTRPWAATGEFKFGSQTVVVREDVVPMLMGLYIVVMKVQGTEDLHIRYAEARADVCLSFIPETAACDLFPALTGKLGDDLIGFAAQRNITIRLAQRSAGSG